MRSIVPADWVTVKVGALQIKGKTIIVPILYAPTPAFQAFIDATEYSAHKFYALLHPVEKEQPLTPPNRRSGKCCCSCKYSSPDDEEGCECEKYPGYYGALWDLCDDYEEDERP